MQIIEVKYLESTIATPTGQRVGEFWFSVIFRQPSFKEIEQKSFK